jgi:DNA-binding MarR family transcriptional regulator
LKGVDFLDSEKMKVVHTVGNRVLLNEFLTDVFHHILKFEEYALSRQGVGDLSIQEMHLIEKLGPDKELRMSQIANVLGVTLGTMTVAADRLDKKGYVVRQRLDDDRRVVKLRLTDKGREAFHFHEEFHLKMADMVLQGLSPLEEETLTQALSNLRDFFMGLDYRKLKKKGKKPE